MEYELTPEAIELGLAVTLPAVHDLGQKREFGRGERACACRSDLSVQVIRLARPATSTEGVAS